MFDKSSLPPWLKKLIDLGDAPSRPRSDTNKRAYRTVYYRYFWAIAFVLGYFLLVAYWLGGDDSGSSDNKGIYKLLIGALLVGGLGAFFAPRLNLALQKLFPEGRRREEDRKRRQSKGRSQGSRSRSSTSATKEAGEASNADLPHGTTSDGLTQTEAKPTPRPKTKSKPKSQSGRS